MGAKEFFDQSVDQATSVIMQVRDEDISNPTPCTEWNVQSLANHMIYELAWVAEIAKGKTISEVGNKYEGDLMTEVWQDRWKSAVDAAREAVGKVELSATAHLSFGDVTMEEYLAQISSDMFIHAWDLGEGINQKVQLPESVVKRLYEFMSKREHEFRSSGLFGKLIDVPEEADPQTKLLAIYGRRIDWHNAQ